MSIYSPIRDAFNDLNKLMIDKQQWDADHAYRAEDQQMKRMQLEQSIEDQKRKRILLDKEVKEAEYAMQPVEVNIYDVLPNNATTQSWLDDQEFRSNVARVYGGVDMDRATGRVVDEGGNPLSMPRMDKERRAVGATGLIEGKMDPMVMIDANQSKIKSDMTSLEAQLKEFKDPRMVGQRAPLEQKLSKLKIAYEQHEKIKAPDQMIALLRNKMAYQTALVSNAAANGADGSLLNILNANATRTQQQILNLEKEMGDEKKWKAQMSLEREKLNLEKEKLNKDKEAKTQMYYAVATDGKGNVSDVTVPGNVLVGGVTKESTAKTPEMAFNNPELKNYVWMEGAELAEKRKGHEQKKSEWEPVLKQVQQRFYKSDAMGNLIGGTTPDFKDRINVSTKVLADIWEKEPDLENTKKINKAENMANVVIDSYWQNRKAIQNEATKEKWTKEELEKSLWDFDQQFNEVYKFVPDQSKWEQVKGKK